MKVKRFNNLWTMGLILTGAILVAFYIAKIFFPEFIVGVAEIPSIVAFGCFVDSHWWANILFQIVISYIGGYIYFCACCRTNHLTWKQNLLHIIGILLGLFIQNFLVEIYSSFNYVIFVLNPFLMILVENKLSKNTFISTICCFSVDIMAQAFSMVIRNVIIMATFVNSATMTILLIDVWIWRALLYMFFNYKINKGE